MRTPTSSEPRSSARLRRQPGRPRRRSRSTTRAPCGGILASKAFRNLALVGATVAAIAIVAVVGFGGGSPSLAAIGAGTSPAPSASAPVLDQVRVGELMAKIQVNPKDADSLMSLGDEYYKIGDFTTAGNWFTKVTELEPANVRGFLALGATAFNQGDLAAAEKAWNQAVAIDENNVEAHYDLGFLYLNEQPADMAGVQREWGKVVELSPNSSSRRRSRPTCALASFSPAAGCRPRRRPRGSPAASPAASGAPASTAPSAAPAASPARP